MKTSENLKVHLHSMLVSFFGFIYNREVVGCQAWYWNTLLEPIVFAKSKTFSDWFYIKDATMSHKSFHQKRFFSFNNKEKAREKLELKSLYKKPPTLHISPYFVAHPLVALFSIFKVVPMDMLLPSISKMIEKYLTTVLENSCKTFQVIQTLHIQDRNYTQIKKNVLMASNVFMKKKNECYAKHQLRVDLWRKEI